MSKVACLHAGVKLAPGSYQVQPNSNAGHIYMTCSTKRTTAFEVDLSNTQLTFTVRLYIAALLHKLNTLCSCGAHAPPQ